MSLPAMRLGGRHQAYVYAVGTLLVLSGALWLLFHYFVRMPGEFGDVAHPLEPWWLRVHGLSAAAFLIGFGSVLPGHVRRAWVGRRNRLSGTLFFSVLALLIASGYALYYMGNEDWRAIVSVLHWVIGLGAPLLLAWHVWRGQARRSLHGKADGIREPVEQASPTTAVVRLRGKH